MSEAASTSDKHIVVYRTFDSVEANALAADLNEAGVDAHVIGDFLDGGYPGLRLGGNAVVEIWVAASQQEAAAPLLAAWANAHHLEAPRDEPKFQFSMLAILVVMTLAAIYMAAAAAEPPMSDVALVTMELALIVGAIGFLVRRWLREHFSGAERHETTQAQNRAEN